MIIRTRIIMTTVMTAHCLQEKRIRIRLSVTTAAVTAWAAAVTVTVITSLAARPAPGPGRGGGIGLVTPACPHRSGPAARTRRQSPGLGKENEGRH